MQGESEVCLGGFRVLVLPPRWLREHQLLLLSVMAQSAVLPPQGHCCNPLYRDCLFPSPERLGDLPSVFQPGSGGAVLPAVPCGVSVFPAPWSWPGGGSRDAEQTFLMEPASAACQ